MLQIRRTEGREEVEHGGRTFTLVSESWTIGVTTRRLGLGWTYRRPRSVEGGPRPTPIRDHLMTARIVAVLLLATTVLIRRSRL
jgi:hypothetical protein